MLLSAYWLKVLKYVRHLSAFLEVLCEEQRDK